MQFHETILNAGGEDLEKRRGPIEPEAYGFLFRDLRLNGWKPSGSGAERDEIFALSETLYGPSAPNKAIPAGYAFFGQFITHDLTFAVTPFAPPINRRTPRFDLDCVYAGGPEAHPFLYELRDPRLLLVGKNEFGEPDLPRNADTSLVQGTTNTFTRRRSALIGDPRNDENTIISQLHLAFLHLHNLLAEDRPFEDARRIVQWSYQHAMLDFLRRVCGRDLVDQVLGKNGEPNLKVFKVNTSRVFMPVEFSFAAFRMGHSMLGETYHLNDALDEDREGRPFLLFADAPPDWTERNKRAQNTLEGQRELPKKWTIQWNRFVGAASGTQPSQLIDPELAEPLRHLPIDVSRGAPDDRERSLAYRTLLSGWLQRLPSGQKIAELLGEKPLAPGEDPLLVYVLREAKETYGGERLGPVGARIVAEVCVGLLAVDPDSFYAQEPRSKPRWQPWKDLGLRRGAGDFGLEDLLRAAGVPITRGEWQKWVPEQAR